jgi:hypothetical protein
MVPLIVFLVNLGNNLLFLLIIMSLLSIASASFDLIYSDVWGPSPVPSMSGSLFCDF